jgi:hypothetical protein
MIKIGWVFYKNGELFLMAIFNGDTEIVKNVNTLLLVGYYLLNIGYAILSIAYWESINNYIDLINSLSLKLGEIMLTLAIMHFNNIFWLKNITHYKTLKQ